MQLVRFDQVQLTQIHPDPVDPGPVYPGPDLSRSSLSGVGLTRVRFHDDTVKVDTRQSYHKRLLFQNTFCCSNRVPDIYMVLDEGKVPLGYAKLTIDETKSAICYVGWRWELPLGLAQMKESNLKLVLTLAQNYYFSRYGYQWSFITTIIIL